MSSVESISSGLSSRFRLRIGAGVLICTIRGHAIGIRVVRVFELLLSDDSDAVVLCAAFQSLAADAPSMPPATLLGSSVV